MTNNKISAGNILTIVILLLTMAVSWGSFSNRIGDVESDLDKKADKEVVEVKLDYIILQIEELKQRVD